MERQTSSHEMITQRNQITPDVLNNK